MSDRRKHIQWGVAGYTADLPLPVFSYCFPKRKSTPHSKAGFVLLNVFLLLPYAGHVLNGLSYVSNRWIWAYGMLIAVHLCKNIPGTFCSYAYRKAKSFCDASDLLYSGAPSGGGKDTAKSDGDGPFVTFDIYRAFLRKYLYQGAKSYGDGCRFPDRRHPV